MKAPRVLMRQCIEMPKLHITVHTVLNRRTAHPLLLPESPVEAYLQS